MARDTYERLVMSGMQQFREAVQDSMLSLKNLYKSILQAEDKEKALNYLHHSAPIAEALSDSRLSSAAKVVENSETDKETEHKIFLQNVLWVGGCRTRRMACQD
jgi:hypothetical protein